jgi:hypothetical protein
MTQPPHLSHSLAAGLTARLIHDIAGLASAITTGLDLYTAPDSDDLKDSALDLATSSGRSLLDRLDFYRTAFGGGDEPHNTETMQRLAARQFGNRRTQLDWPTSATALPSPAGQVLLIMVQVASDAVMANGTIQVALDSGPGHLSLKVEGKGPRVLFHPEVMAGLVGLDHHNGVAGRWAPAFYLHTLVTAAAGLLSIDLSEGGFLMEAALPT